MQATSMRPHKKHSLFLAFTGVPLGPLPMNATGGEPNASDLSVDDARDVMPDVDDIVAAYCA